MQYKPATAIAIKRLCDALEARYDKPAHEVLRVGRRTVERWYGGHMTEPGRPSPIPRHAHGVLLYVAFDENIFNPVNISDDKKNALKIISKIYGDKGYIDLSLFIGKDSFSELHRYEIAERLGMNASHLGYAVAQSKKEKRVKHTVYCALCLICGVDVDIKTGGT